jgi:MtN3 and saliva related transmembrane protein
VKQDIICALGIIAGICTTVSFVPQVLKMLRTKNVNDVSLGMYIVFTFGVLLWLLYGFILGQAPIILANIATLVFCSIILHAKIKYTRR